MKHAVLIRDEVSAMAIRGRFIIGQSEFQILERPWLKNARNKSCIPSGEYQAHYMERSASGKYRNVYHIVGVAGRSGILIHNGNIVAHSRGCLIIGMKRGVLAGQPAVLNSRTALRELYRVMGDESFYLTVIGNQKLLNR